MKVNSGRLISLGYAAYFARITVHKKAIPMNRKKSVSLASSGKNINRRNTTGNTSKTE
jgi:hypothetical protein